MEGRGYYNITDPASLSTVDPITFWRKPTARMIAIPWYGNYSLVELGPNGVGAWVLNLTGIEEPGFLPNESPVFLPGNNVASLFATDKRIYSTTAGTGNTFQIHSWLGTSFKPQYN